MSTMSRVDRLMCMAGPLTEPLYGNAPEMAESLSQLVLPCNVEIVEIDSAGIESCTDIEVETDDRGRLQAALITRNSEDVVLLEREWRGGLSYVDRVVVMAGKPVTGRSVMWSGNRSGHIMVSRPDAEAAAGYRVVRTAKGLRGTVDEVTTLLAEPYMSWQVARGECGALAYETRSRNTLVAGPAIIGKRVYGYDDHGRLNKITIEGLLDGDSTTLVQVDRPDASTTVVAGYESGADSENLSKMHWREVRTSNARGLVEYIMHSTVGDNPVTTTLKAAYAHSAGARVAA